MQLDKRIKKRKMLAELWAAFIGGMICTFLALCFCGCVYKGGKITDGTELSIGLNVPATDGVGQLSVLNYVGGFRVGVATDAQMTVRRRAESNSSFLGCVTLAETNDTEVVISPCVTDCGTNATISATVESN